MCFSGANNPSVVFDLTVMVSVVMVLRYFTMNYIRNSPSKKERYLMMRKKCFWSCVKSSMWRASLKIFMHLSVYPAQQAKFGYTSGILSNKGARFGYKSEAS